MELTAPTLVAPQATVRLGRTRALHVPRVLIEDSRVVVRTVCGLDLGGDREIAHAFPSCDDCLKEP